MYRILVFALQEHQKRQEELEKINSLDEKITQELANLKEKMQIMEVCAKLRMIHEFSTTIILLRTNAGCYRIVWANSKIPRI